MYFAVLSELPMDLLNQLGVATGSLHFATDEDVLFDAPTSMDYRRYLTRMYGFVLSAERSIRRSPLIDGYIDARRFHKHELLRTDLRGLRMTLEQIADLPLCAVPLSETPEEALGLAYLIERSTWRHGHLLRHLTATFPGEIAFSSAYLKCYSGVVGEMWQSFGHALKAFEGSDARKGRLIEAARAAFRCFHSWRGLHDQREGIASPRAFAALA